MKESILIENIRLHIQAKYPNSRLFKRVTGSFKIKGRFVKINSPGQADLDGWVMVSKRPIFVAIEVKTAGVAMSPQQRSRKAAFEGLGVIYHVVREDSYAADLEELGTLLGRYV